MEIKFLLSNHDLFCSRCQDKNIKNPTILKGAGYYILIKNDLTLNACLECFALLKKETI